MADDIVSITFVNFAFHPPPALALAPSPWSLLFRTIPSLRNDNKFHFSGNWTLCFYNISQRLASGRNCKRCVKATALSAHFPNWRNICSASELNNYQRIVVPGTRRFSWASFSICECLYVYFLKWILSSKMLLMAITRQFLSMRMNQNNN